MGRVRRPVLRYHGGKWKLAPWLVSLMPAHRVYVEPYGGAASVLLRKPRSYAEVYNDLDGEIVNVFRVLRDPEKSRELVRILEFTPYSRTEFEGAYERSDDVIEQARRTVVKSMMGFGSASITLESPTAAGAGYRPGTGYRAASNRTGTAPPKDWMRLPSELRSVIERLRGVTIENRDAGECMKQHDSPATLHYCDPPYVHDTRGGRQWRLCKSYRHEMSDEEHAAMIGVLNELEGMVMLSGYRCEMYDELLKGWARYDKDTHADGARPRMESVWMNDRAHAGHGLFAGAMDG